MTAPATGHLSPLELRLLERVEQERASLLPATASHASNKERREAELRKWSVILIVSTVTRVQPWPTGLVQSRVLILGFNRRE